MSQRAKPEPSLEGVQGVADQRAEVTMKDISEPSRRNHEEPDQFPPFVPRSGDLPAPDIGDDPATGSRESLQDLMVERPSNSEVETLERPLRDSTAELLIGTPVMNQSFEAVNEQSYAALGAPVFFPPDAAGAAGPNHLMAVHNGIVSIQNKNGLRLVTRTLDAFWAAFLPFHGIGGIFDPRVLYDSLSQRWIFTACDNARLATSGILVAVSQNQDPMGTWYLYRVPIAAVDSAWADFPSVGFNQFWIVIQVNLIVGNTVNRSRVYAFDKADLLRGDTGAFTLFELTTVTISGQQFQLGGFQVPIAIDGTSGSSRDMFLIQNWNSNSNLRGWLRLWNLTDSGLSTGNPPYPIPALSLGPFVSTSNTWSSNPPSVNFGPQLGSSQNIALNDDRIHNTVVLHREDSEEFIHAAQTVFLPTGAPTRSAIQVWKIRADGTVANIVRIDDPSGANFYAFPSISITRNNLAIVGYANFSSAYYPRAEWSYWDVTDPAAVPIRGGLLRSGEGPYVRVDNLNRNRWGDYTSTVLDPTISGEQVIWTLQEYARQPAATGANPGRWGTWWSSFTYPYIT